MSWNDILHFDQTRQGRAPETGQTYDYGTIALDLQHPDVRQAIHIG